MKNQPTQYKIGYSEFYKLKFFVDARVLIPRPETELLVETALKFANSLPSPSTGEGQGEGVNQQICILDVGTGSGCISIPIAKNLAEAKVVALDISKEALDVAKKNARLHGVENQIEFMQSDLLSVFPPPQAIPHLDPPPLEEGGNQTTIPSHSVNTPPPDSGRGWVGVSLRATRHAPRAEFDIIVANLPYIPSSRIPTLDCSVKDFEPHLALDGGEDGFELYRKLFVEMIQKNIYPLYFLGEIDITHSEVAKKEAEKYFPRAKVEIRNDLTKRPRFLLIQF